MGTWLWIGVLGASVFATWWGAGRVAVLLRMLRRRWGLSEAAGAAVIALATASPEIGVNLAAALRGEADIGLGNMLGANIVPIPLVLAVAFLASWRRGDRPGNEGGRELLVLQPAAVRVPLGFVSVVIQDLTLYLLNLGFVLLMPLAYIALARAGTRRLGFALPQILVLLGLYAAYVAVAWLFVL